MRAVAARLLHSNQFISGLTFARASVSCFGTFHWSQTLISQAARKYSRSARCAAGHSKWDNIRHDKAKNDAAKGRQRDFHAAEISVASRRMYASSQDHTHLRLAASSCSELVGGPNPKVNPRLADAIAKARRASLPRANIEAAVARGQGLSATGQKLEPFIEEALLTPSIALIIEGLTDNKHAARVAVRKILKYLGAVPSSVMYLFKQRGRIQLASLEGPSEEDILDQALSCGALDVRETPRGWAVITNTNDTARIAEHFKSTLGMAVEQVNIIWDAREQVQIEDETMMANFQLLLRQLEELAFVQDIYTNAK